MRVKSKKKLALLVGMALTVGSTLAVNPMDVYAATSVAWDADNGKYKVTVGSSEESFTDASDAIAKIIAGLGTETDKDITIDLSDATWQSNEDSQNAAKKLAAALRDQSVTLKDGAEVKLTFANGDAYNFVNGNGDSVVNLGSDSVLKVDGNITKVTAQVAGGRTAKIDVAEGKEVGTITVNDGTNGSLALTGKGTVTKLQANGDVTVSATDTTLTGIEVAADKTLTTTGDIKAESITGNGNVTVNGAVTAANVTTTGALKADSVTTTGALEAGSVTTTGALEAGSVTTTGALEAGSVTTTGALEAGSVTTTGALEAGSVTTTGAISADSVTTTGNLVVGGNLTAKEVTADSVTLKGTAANSDFGEKITINANSVTLDTTSGTADNINKMNLVPKTAGGTVNVKVITSNGSLDSGVEDAIKAAVGSNDVTITATSKAADEAQAKADDAIAAADDALKKAIPLAAVDADTIIAKANPFATKLPSASDIAAVASPTKDQLQSLETAKGELKTAIQGVDTQIEVAKSANNEPLQKDLEAKKAELEKKAAGLSTTGMQAKAAELTAAVQQAGKTAAAPGVASARTATVVINVMTANVTGRTSELRGFASAVDEGRPAPDNVWFQYKHTNMDVDNGDVYGKSTVKTNNYQLGYDAKVGPNDYLGAYIGTTTGNVEFNAPAVTDRTDIDNAYDFGIYGTHMLPSDQYIDYMIHTGKFDSKYNGVTWGTKDTGAMIGYGAKIAQNDRLTWNPYIQLAYDKVSVDSYMAGPNYIASDDSNNWTAKLGINLLDVSGFYGGLAYSRGLSGSYNAYINGVPMPSQDNNANVLYMSLGYRANMSRNVFLDLSMEKTFADYNGWTAAGKVNFYF